MRRARFVTVLLGLVAAGIAGCEGIPTHMHVRHGVEPQNADKDVVFRTTYYFRVFDVCDAANPAGTTGKPLNTGDELVFVNKHGRGQRLLKDSLYRFVMTGKANPLTTQINFESGTLKSYEIDPLGATVAFDEDNRRFLFKSRAETELEARRSQVGSEIERLLALKERLSADDTDPALISAVDAVILEQVRTLSPTTIGGFSGNRQLSDTAEKQNAAAKVADALATTIEKLAPASLSESRTKALEKLAAFGDVAGTSKQKIVDYAAALVKLKAEVEAVRPLLTNAADQLKNDPAKTDALTALASPMVKLQAEAGAAASKRQAALDALNAVEAARSGAGTAQSGFGDGTSELLKGLEGTKGAADRLADLIGKAAEQQRSIDTQNRVARNASDQAATLAETANKARSDLIAAVKALAKTALPAPSVTAAAIRTKIGTITDQTKILNEKYAAAAKTIPPASRGQAETELREALAAADKIVAEFATLPVESAASVVDAEVRTVGDAATALEGAEAAVTKVVEAVAALGKAYRDVAQKMSSAGATNAASAYSIVSQQLADPEKACDESGGNVRRGFQIMGPEGLKTFDQEDRLIMAMSTSAKPLIGMLKDLSGRVLQQRAAGADQLLPLARERSAILRAQRGLDRARAAKDATPESIVDATIAGFDQGREQ